MQALAASCEELRARTGNPPLELVRDYFHTVETLIEIGYRLNRKS